ncbi:hypothetical protein QYE76_038774 [Lolium multiflorum]|uniref:Retrotransposon gag domain-containing protein n=1 Tax=Lolium multiflorum TaxID=4521 RepID=A0AAD8WT69_LOLMU|nr:hypothetical protein QYE76_038774 [Lolium multiflorum]
MLVGSARTWLNNLPAGSINGWLDFEEAFICNFTGSYRRPSRPQQLEMCKQGPDETDRAYLMRWCEMRNSCEGVHEIRAIASSWAAAGPTPCCGTSCPQAQVHGRPHGHRRQVRVGLKKPARRRLSQRRLPPGGTTKSRLSTSRQTAPLMAADNYRGKRRDQPDRRCGSAHVAPCIAQAAAAAEARPAMEAVRADDRLAVQYHSGKNPPTTPPATATS